MTNIDFVAREVQEAYDSAIRITDSALRNDRVLQAENAGDGSTVTFGNSIKNERLRKDATDSVCSARLKAHKAVERALSGARGALTDPPSTDEANYIVAVSVRDDLTEYEVHAALDRYKSHSAQRAIRNAAKRSGLKTIDGMTETEATIEALEKMDELIDREFSLDRLCRSSVGSRCIARNMFAAVGDTSGSIKKQFRKMLQG